MVVQLALSAQFPEVKDELRDTYLKYRIVPGELLNLLVISSTRIIDELLKAHIAGQHRTAGYDVDSLAEALGHFQCDGQISTS
jgi:hypothetical protein